MKGISVWRRSELLVSLVDDEQDVSRAIFYVEQTFWFSLPP